MRMKQKEAVQSKPQAIPTPPGFFGCGRAAKARAATSEEFAPLSKSSLQSGWQIWSSSEYGLGDYYVYLQLCLFAARQIPRRAVQAEALLTRVEWKLARIDPPKQMLIQLAQEPVKQRADKKD